MDNYHRRASTRSSQERDFKRESCTLRFRLISVHTIIRELIKYAYIRQVLEFDFLEKETVNVISLLLNFVLFFLTSLDVPRIQAHNVF